MDSIFIYGDKKSSTSKSDKKMLPLILNYLNTPQYLRKSLYDQIPELQYAGILNPLQTPHHVKKIHFSKIKIGDIRMGVIQRKKNNNSSRIKKKQNFIDVGLDRPVLFYGNGYDGNLVTAKFISIYPNLKTVEAQDEDIIHYWGYDVVKISSLDFLLSIIYDYTSKNSKIINKNERIFGNKFIKYCTRK